MPDVNIKAVIPQLAGGLWFNAGQVCIATRRMYIHQDIFDDVVAQLAEASKDLASGMEPIQNEMQFVRLKRALADADAAGYELLSLRKTEATEGFFIQPTILKNPPPDADVVQQENFGTWPGHNSSHFLHRLTRSHRPRRIMHQVFIPR